MDIRVLTSASKVPVEASLTALSFAASASAVLLVWQIKASITTALSLLAFILCHRDVILSIAPFTSPAAFSLIFVSTSPSSVG